MRKLLGLLSVAVLFGMVARAQAGLAAFDDLLGDHVHIPVGYAGFTWSDSFYYLNASGHTGSGYSAGMVSSPNVAYNSSGYNVTVSAATPFTFNGAYFTGVWNDGLNIDIKGLRDGSEVYSTTVTVSSTIPTWVGLDWTNVDALTFHSYGGTPNGEYIGGAGTHFAMDNFTFNEPVSDSEGPITASVLATPNPVMVGSSVTVTAGVRDDTTGGSNIVSAEFTLDGSSSGMGAADGAFDEVSEDVTVTFTAPATPGVYDLCVRAMDSAGNVGDPECIPLVVYDPDGGFVTGRGWIDSPAGAYVPDPAVAGKADFRFMSKYLRGATAPMGDTEFQFKANDLSFHSSSCDWLGVTGSNYAKFKGTGTINGAGGYKFQVWVGDSDPDTFRIRIWTEDGGTENVVYDNGMDQAIDGGSIVIRTR